METISGSVVESATPYCPPEYQKQKKQNKIFMLATIVEAIAVVVLAAILAVVVAKSNADDLIDIEDPTSGEMNGVEFPEFAISKKESDALMYIYSIVDDNTLGNSVAQDTCSVITKLYNQYTIDGSNLGNVCQDGQLTLAASKTESDMYPYLTLNLLTVVTNGVAYGLYMYPDFQAFNYARILDTLPENTTVVSVGY